MLQDASGCFRMTHARACARACRSLGRDCGIWRLKEPPRWRFWGVIWGSGTRVVCRIVSSPIVPSASSPPCCLQRTSWGRVGADSSPLAHIIYIGRRWGRPRPHVPAPPPRGGGKEHCKWGGGNVLYILRSARDPRADSGRTLGGHWGDTGRTLSGLSADSGRTPASTRLPSDFQPTSIRLPPDVHPTSTALYLRPTCVLPASHLRPTCVLPAFYLRSTCLRAG